MFRLPVDGSIQLLLLEAEHAPLLFSLIERNRRHLHRWLPWLDECTRVEDSSAFIDQAHERHAEREGLDLSIWHRDRLVGMVAFNDFSWRDRRGSIGYWLDAASQGKGIATRACHALLTHGFDALDLNRVEIRCSPANLRSRAIPLRLGFTCEGLIRQAEWLYDHFEDHEIHGLLAAAWKERT